MILAKIWPKNGQKQWKFENYVVKIYKGGRYTQFSGDPGTD